MPVFPPFLLLFLSPPRVQDSWVHGIRGGVTSAAPRKFISRFNAAALLALIYIHSPKPQTASGARLVPLRHLETLLARRCRDARTGKVEGPLTTDTRSPAKLIKADGAWRVLVEALIFFISEYLGS